MPKKQQYLGELMKILLESKTNLSKIMDLFQKKVPIIVTDKPRIDGEIIPFETFKKIVNNNEVIYNKNKISYYCNDICPCLICKISRKKELDLFIMRYISD